MGVEDLADSKAAMALSSILLNLMVDSKQMQAKMLMKFSVLTREKSTQARILCTIDKMLYIYIYIYIYEIFLVLLSILRAFFMLRAFEYFQVIL
jgi:hypothetical protein